MTDWTAVYRIANAAMERRNREMHDEILARLKTATERRMAETRAERVQKFVDAVRQYQEIGDPDPDILREDRDERRRLAREDGE